MSNEQIGVYVRLLCAQHQHGGMIEKKAFNSMVDKDSILRSKFIETEHGFYNERLMKEMNSRVKKSTNVSEAVKKVWEERRKSMESHKNPIAIPMGTEDENEDVNKDLIKNVIADLNQKAGTDYKPSSKKTATLINARVSEGFKQVDFFYVNGIKCAEWLGTEQQKYLRPETLYGTKFEGYLNQKPQQKKIDESKVTKPPIYGQQF